MKKERKLRKSELTVDFLKEKFGDKSDPSYIFKNINCEDIEEKKGWRKVSRVHHCRWIFQILSSFLYPKKKNESITSTLMIVKENFGIDFDDIDDGKKKEVTAKMLVRDTVVALAANPKSCESFYLIKIKGEEKETREDVDDGFRHVIKKEMKHLEIVFRKEV